MKWGAEIPVDGKRPAWLRDTDVMDVRNKFGWQWSNGKWIAGECGNWPPQIAIRLPADHWAYKAIEKGFTPWAGIGEAPMDWSCAEVLRANGVINRPPNSKAWGLSRHLGGSVIGYRKREAPLPAALLEINHAAVHKISPQHNSIADTVLENRRLVARVEELLRANNDLVEENRRLKRAPEVATFVLGPDEMFGSAGGTWQSVYGVGDSVTLLPAEDGEILPGGTYTIASIGDGGTTMRMEGHPKVVVHAHRIAPKYTVSFSVGGGKPAYFHLGAEGDRD